MQGIFVLIMMVELSSSTALISQEFGSLAACERAGKAFSDTGPAWFRRVVYVCSARQ